ncbi:hypothetical protein FCH79_01265 [Pseudomonas koreensis]|uniref:hypothetical protein n=1 Tax=Pseudomonas koreensis TaxID=198620 RepID=UPI001575967E|nr:hypothetical protein [Pseudomonas koreensis]NTZ93955.1 hypothetical protein [Pseudomonas koreensis]
MCSLSRLNELFFENNCVAAIKLEMVDFKYSLSLTMSSSEDPETEGVTAVFHDVSALNLSGFGGGLTQLMDLVVTRIDRGLDRIRYELRDIENEKNSFYFFTFTMRDHKE